MRPVTALVAEDEAVLREELCMHLAALWPELHVAAQASNGLEALQLMERHRPDVLFLDIQMPGLTGLDVVEDLPRPFPIVFVTAFAEHAVKAFEQNAVDYLLKPVTAERLAKTLERLQGTRVHRGEAAPKPSGPFRVPVKAGDGLIFLDLAKVTHFTYEDEQVLAHAGGPFRTLWKTLAEAEEAMTGRGLVRGHRHLLIRPEAVVGVKPGEFGRLLVRLAGGTEVEVSRGAAPDVKKRLGLS